MTTSATTITPTHAASRDAARPTHVRRFGSIRAEGKRLNRPSFTGVGLGLILFFALMASAVTFLADGNAGPAGRGAVTDLTSSQGLVAALSIAGDLIGIVALALWAAAAASDYSTGWIRVLVQAEPRRWRLLGGKLVALIGYTVVGTALATLATVVVAWPLAGVADVSTAAWSAGALGTVISGWVNLTLSVMVWGVIGLAVATVTRSVTVAIAGGIGYLLVFEGILTLLFESATTYLPGSVLSAVVAGGTTTMSYAAAMSLAIGYALAAVVVAAWVFTRRDITS